jgi:hypothetical protein
MSAAWAPLPVDREHRLRCRGVAYRAHNRGAHEVEAECAARIDRGIRERLDALRDQLGERLLRFRREDVVANECFLGLPGELEAATVETTFARLLAGDDIDLVHFQQLAGRGTLHCR